MKLLIAALALLSFVATSTLPETVVAQAATGQTQTAPATPDTGGTMQKAPTHKGKKKHSTKKHITKKHHKKKSAKKHHKKKSSKPKKPANPS